jgi:hypothetical protein
LVEAVIRLLALSVDLDRLVEAAAVDVDEVLVVE